MLFNSIEFALFFPVVCALYFALQPRWRTPLLLAASCVFYMAFIPAYILILGLTIGIDYTAALYLEKATGPARRRLLVVSIVSTCLVLFVFKYFGFFTGTFVGLAGLVGWQLSNPSITIILPIGLSFHTFQSLSYVVEVYRGRQQAEKNFLTFATYVMFFPQLVAGPIERPQHLLHQFGEVHEFDYARVVGGLKRMAWGFFKKLVIADRVAFYVNDVYADSRGSTGLQLAVATVFFAYQIYCDFSGYSDIAIGSARVLGFELVENFQRPYQAASVAEFWRRWHVSLSTWFRDYVYVPLGGNRVGPLAWIRNVLVTFGISGLWHGAHWTFVVWGLLNGVYLIVGRFTHPLRERLGNAIGLGEETLLRRGLMIGTTFVLTCAGWVVFRSASLADAAYIFTHATQNWSLAGLTTTHFQLKHFPPALAAIVVLECAQWLNAHGRGPERIAAFPTLVRWPVYVGFVFTILLFGVYRSTYFIYFQF